VGVELCAQRFTLLRVHPRFGELLAFVRCDVVTTREHTGCERGEGEEKTSVHGGYGGGLGHSSAAAKRPALGLGI
jgi:hypothetical protein